jgi:hypothetical protein
MEKSAISRFAEGPEKHGLHGRCESYSVCDVLLAQSKYLIAVPGASRYYG